MTQDDVLFPHLTVKETLTYTALLRLPKTLTKLEKEQRAGSVIQELGLERYIFIYYYCLSNNLGTSSYAKAKS